MELPREIFLYTSARLWPWRAIEARHQSHRPLSLSLEYFHRLIQNQGPRLEHTLSPVILQKGPYNYLDLNPPSLNFC